MKKKIHFVFKKAFRVLWGKKYILLTNKKPLVLIKQREAISCVFYCLLIIKKPQSSENLSVKINFLKFFVQVISYYLNTKIKKKKERKETEKSHVNEDPFFSFLKLK